MKFAAIAACALALSLLLRLIEPEIPEDAPLMATSSAQVGFWLAHFMVSLVIVGTLYYVGKGLLRLFRK